jgi:hypothetical protein
MRPEQRPYERLYERANADAQQAELVLLRNLLEKSYNALIASGCADESLMRDILTVLEKRPALVP